MNKLFLTILTILLPLLMSAQTVTGIVLDNETGDGIEGVLVTSFPEKKSTITNINGQFSLVIKESGTISIDLEGYESYSVDVEISSDANDNSKIDLGVLNMTNIAGSNNNDIPTIILDENALDDSDAFLSDNISGLLTASRDPFVSEAAYTLGSYRFRMRGYDSENSNLILNGVPMNELENGRIYYNVWGGLNDVFRNRQNDIGLSATDYTFGGVGGNTSMDTRASNQRKQTRVSYASSNRSYRNRVMLTHSTGMMKNGWGFSFSGSRRWAEEGYIQGTVYDGYSYFASIDRKVTKNHLLNLTFFGTPTTRGRNGAATQEAYDIVGSNYYNPHWGFQNGEKRNSRIQKSHQPVGILRHDWTINEKSTLTTAASYQTGRNGQTRLDWFNAADPRPNYYRNLPSYLEFREEAPEAAAEYRAHLEANPDLLQIDFDALYEANRNFTGSVDNANGIEGNTMTGKWSRYILEEQRYDSDEFNINSNLNTQITDDIAVTAGVRYQTYTGHNFKLIDDLLGGEFTVDIDKFAEREEVDNLEDFQQNDLNNPNRILVVGDTYGWNYDINITKLAEWAQLTYQGKRIDAFLSGEFESTKFWRNGIFKNGRFPDSSEGESEKAKFNNFGVKGGLTYKLNGRNYLYANAAIQTKAPFSRNAFVSPRTRNQLVPNLESEKITSIEGGYNLRSPKIKGRLTGYFTQFKDGNDRIGFYDDARRTFGSLIIQNIDRQHAGIEAGVEVKITSSLSATAVAGIGQNIYTSRQEGSFYLDNNDEFSSILIDDKFTIYSNEFFVANGPQDAYSFKLSYQGKKFWFANLSVSYFDDIYMDFSPIRRTESAVYGLDSNPELFDRVIAQEQADSQVTVDFFGGKSFKFNDLFLYLNVGVSNILDNQKFVTGGYEQLRFNYATKNPDDFPVNKFYSYGRNYFISLTLKL